MDKIERMTAAEMHTRLLESVQTTLAVMSALATVPDVLTHDGVRALQITELAKAVRGLTEVASALTLER